MSTVLIVGGAGFLGSHLARAHRDIGDEVWISDTLISGRRANIEDLLSSGGSVHFREDGWRVPPDPRTDDGLWNLMDAPKIIYHLASLASPVFYRRFPMETLDTGSALTIFLLQKAEQLGSRLVFASSSEVYGDPLISPQRETHRGNVSCFGPRAPYDESKRFGEAACYAYKDRVSVGIARIFNTYGPGMRRDDGRLVPSVLNRLACGLAPVIEGDGIQTRSLCYVDDMIRALMLLGDSSVTGPINLGATEERSVCDIVQLVQRLWSEAGGGERILAPLFEEGAPDDPALRRPDISRAGQTLGWVPRVSLEEGLRLTVADYITAPP